MRRRAVIALLGGAAVAWPLAAYAPQPPDRLRRIGVLMARAAHDAEGQSQFAALQDGLEQLGWRNA